MQALLSNLRHSVRVAEIADPKPAPHQALVRVEAISINRGETFQLDAPPPDWRPGKDFAGTVIQQAPDGSGPARGTRVVGHGLHSCWAECVAISTDRVVPLPDSVSLETAAALPLAGLTALRLARRACLSPGTRVLMTGASGGVGHYFAELCDGAGAELTAVVGSTERGAALRSFGTRTVTDLSVAGTGFDVGLESVGGASLAEVRRRVATSGRIVWFGQVSRTPVTLDFFDWVDDTAGAPIIQFHYLTSDRPLRRDLATLVDLTARGRLHPELDRVRPVAEAAAAIDDLRQRRIRGNLVLTWS